MPYKGLTHDYRPPIQGGDPIWDGTPGAVLPKIQVDRTEAECGVGWHFCDTVAQVLTLVGQWPDGRPAAVIEVEPIGQAEKRDNKRRVASLRLVRQLSEQEIRFAVLEISAAFGAHQETMCDAQMAWRDALARLLRDKEQVQAGLTLALKARGLEWTLKEYGTVEAAWNAREAWDAWTARKAWAARAVWEAWTAWDAWDAWGAREAWAAWDAWTARDARDAMTLQYAALQGWIQYDPLFLTTGLQDAHRHGLGIALPTDKDTLGWSMI